MFAVDLLEMGLQVVLSVEAAATVGHVTLEGLLRRMTLQVALDMFGPLETRETQRALVFFPRVCVCIVLHHDGPLRV